MKTLFLVTVTLLLLASCQPAPPGEPTAPWEEPGAAGPEPATGKQRERIRFPAEGDSVEIFAELSAGVTDSFVLAAEQGQILSVEITAPHNDVHLAVAGEDDTPLKHAENGPPSWAAELPATQDYTLQAVSVGQATSYIMRIWLETPVTGAREQIALEGEGTSITRSGALPAGGVAEYVMPAVAGETLHVQTVGYHAPVQIMLTGPDGRSWSGEQGASEVYISVAQVQLSQDGDYVVTLAVPEGAGATHFDVAFTLATSAFLDGDLPAVPPERVEFEHGAGSALLSGRLPSGRAVKQYLVPASAGQTMTVTLDSGAVPVSLTLREPGGAERFPEAFLEEGRYTITHTLTVSETGDYMITLGKAEQAPGVAYELGITIR